MIPQEDPPFDRVRFLLAAEREQQIKQGKHLEVQDVAKRYVRFEMRMAYLDYLTIEDMTGLEFLGGKGSKVGHSTAYCSLEDAHFDAGMVKLEECFGEVTEVPEQEWPALRRSIPAP